LPAAAAAAAAPVNEEILKEPETAEISLPTPPDIDQKVSSAIQAMKTASPIGGKTHLEAVKTLRQLLSNYEDPPTLAVLSSKGIPALISALQPAQSTQTSVETIFEAAWALTNLAVGEPEVVKAVVPAAPVLIALLGGDSGSLVVAEQCAWALGNIAGDDVEYRETLISNGAVPPLAQLMISGVQAALAAGAAASQRNENLLNLTEGQQQTITTGATASWALANLLRGAGETEIAAFMSTDGAAAALAAALSLDTATEPSPAVPSVIDNLCLETAWVLAYVTAGPEKFLPTFIQDPILLIPALNSKLIAAVKGMFLMSDDGGGGLTMESVARGLVTPLLRTLGNILAASSSIEKNSSFISAQLIPDDNFVHQQQQEEEMNDDLFNKKDSELASETIKSVVMCAESAHDHGLQREAAWVLANYAGCPGRSGVDTIKKAGAVPALMSLLKEQPFHVRKEAAFALANICAGGGGGTGDAEALNYLFGADVPAVHAMLSLVRSADIEAARLGLQFVEMLLRMLPGNGAREVEAADGIAAIESLQFGATAPAELQAAAAALVNTYWGVD
jgi:importin subunit alpha-1